MTAPGVVGDELTFLRQVLWSLAPQRLEYQNEQLVVESASQWQPTKLLIYYQCYYYVINVHNYVPIHDLKFYTLHYLVMHTAYVLYYSNTVGWIWWD